MNDRRVGQRYRSSPAIQRNPKRTRQRQHTVLQLSNKMTYNLWVVEGRDEVYGSWGGGLGRTCRTAMSRDLSCSGDCIYDKGGILTKSFNLKKFLFW
jgi:hypothetical protein